ncbi:MAG: asparaginase [Alphaproteobacteria bacterium]|nr:asparaginase [Alphaproteobacteria bacterium]
MEFAKLAEVWRGPIVESVHFGVAAVANAAGEILHGWGDPSIVTFPRSSLKPIQAIALVETGAADAFGLSERHIALSSASHTGEAIHTDLVRAWLKRLDLDEAALACGLDFPRDLDLLSATIRSGQTKSRLFHNCSGKHCGFLTVARHMGWPVEGYNDPAHPTQALYLETLSEFLGRDATALPLGVDGCTLPAPAMSIADMAVAMARYAAAAVASPRRKEAIYTIQEAVARHPEYMSGTNHPTALVVRATNGGVIMKTGAEGYLAAFLPSQALGVALKVADGNSRARVLALLNLLQQLDLIEPAAQRELTELFAEPIYDSTGKTVGKICACGGGLDGAAAMVSAD